MAQSVAVNKPIKKLNYFKSSVAGLLINLPSSVNLDPWQGQSQLCSAEFHFKAQPKWGHRFLLGVKSPFDKNTGAANE